jgi:peptidyl-dipeptidase Dcp
MSLHNPLFEKSHLRDEAVCFSKIKTEHFLPALETAINLAKKNIEAIKQLKEIPSFENTIEALETSGEDVERVSGVFYYLYSAEGPDDLQALAKEMAPRLAAFGSDISLDPVLFEKIKSLYDLRQQLSLNTEQ